MRRFPVDAEIGTDNARLSHGFAVFSNTAVMTSRRSVARRTDGLGIYDFLGNVVLDEISYLPSLDSGLLLFAKALLLRLIISNGPARKFSVIGASCQQQECRLPAKLCCSGTYSWDC
jgi:hypothetical protein